MVRSGEIDYDAADEVERMVGYATDLNRHTAVDLLPTLEKITAEFARQTISVCGSKISIKVPSNKLREAQIKLASRGVQQEVEIDVVD